MGAGKSTIGRQLATALGWEFEDSDQEIVRRTGVTIPVIFEIEGEDGFRRREARVLQDLAAAEHLVLATGGGAVLREENRTLLKERGFVVYLHAGLEQLLERTARDKNRPLLQTSDPRARMMTLLEQRDPLYRQTADLVVETDQRTVKGAVKEIIRQFRAAS